MHADDMDIVTVKSYASEVTNIDILSHMHTLEIIATC